MRPLALVVLAAACGGSPPASTTAPRDTPKDSVEDWRGYLGQIAGAPCNWIPGASFLACIQPAGETTTTLIGWEANNRRYVAWRLARNGTVSVMPGNAANAGWLFESPDGTITFTRDATGGWAATGLAAANVIVMPDPAARPPGPDAPPRSSEDWRSSLEPFVGDWAFIGTVRGTEGAAQLSCKWIAAATFIACTSSNDEAGFTLIGWEPHNARYAMYRFSATAVDVMVGTRTNKDWTFASAKSRATFGWDTAIRRNYKEEEAAGGGWKIVTDGTLETSIE